MREAIGGGAGQASPIVGQQVKDGTGNKKAIDPKEAGGSLRKQYYCRLLDATGCDWILQRSCATCMFVCFDPTLI